MVINITTNRSIYCEQRLPLILTLKLDLKTFCVFDQLRQQYFPPERNVIPAHVTLFHNLPGEREALPGWALATDPGISIYRLSKRSTAQQMPTAPSSLL